ncbi:putative entry exclusion protein TrbK-alt [Bradyrhizobium sp. CCGB01]|uniref:putative entry exclusion protein TrbK-alt n=1 Tax=Bradyrhizobium sp. CCGB01 TaxID=2949634 RepID=UPI0020B25044|nr:putative entry exclusion protein TrbK-alt [Bradyrhizobium sp. CCGB01]MCP3411277.1 putative entry exclusion protein TrbK-alt [Bradyrhizobium sp. CCGB01]
MTGIRAFKALSLLTTIGVFAVAACTIQLRGGEESPPPPKAEHTTGATGSDLARCRSVAPEDAAGYQRCKRVWDENRRRFFGKKDGPAVPGHDDSAASLVPAPKDQSRMPQGYPPMVTPDASKP